MLDLAVLPAFVGVTLLFLLPPGPDMACVVGAGLAGGRRAAVAAVTGIGAGMAMYVGAAAVGLGEVLRSAPGLLDAVQLLGAAYLVWLAVATVRGRRGGGAAAGSGAGGPWRRGLVVSLTNPKVLLFYVAVLPQFVGGADDVRAQLVVLGLVNVVLEVTLYGGLGVAAAVAGERSGSGRGREAVAWVAGAVYVVLATVVVAEVVVG